MVKISKPFSFVFFSFKGLFFVTAFPIQLFSLSGTTVTTENSSDNSFNSGKKPADLYPSSFVNSMSVIGNGKRKRLMNLSRDMTY